MKDIMQRRFGTSDLLQLASHDWLEAGMHAKTVKFSEGSGGLPSEVNWEDKAAAVALIDDTSAKALASLLLWGNDDKWDWSQSFNEVVSHLTRKMIGRCNASDRGDPKGKYTLEELAGLMARMVLHFELYDLWPLYTEEGRLVFSGIEISPNTYQQIWRHYQRLMLNDLENLKWDIDESLKKYRKRLNKVECDYDSEVGNVDSINYQQPQVNDLWETPGGKLQYAVLEVTKSTVTIRCVQSKKVSEIDIDLLPTRAKRVII